MSIQVDPVSALAQEIVSDFMKTQPAKLDPMSIAMLIQVVVQVITSLVQMFKACNQTPETALGHARNPGLLTRIRLNWALRQHTPAKFVSSRDALASAVIRVLAARDTETVARTFAAVTNS